MRRPLLAFAAALIASFALFYCADRDNPSDPLSARYQDVPVEARTPPANRRPQIDSLFVRPDTADTGVVISFRCVASDSDGRIASFRWDFGDMGIDSVSSPSHSYRDSGNYQVVIQVADDSVALVFDTLFVRVNRPPYRNVAPRITTMNALPNPADTGVLVSFTCTATDTDGVITQYFWSFGDSTANSLLQNPTHIYHAAGNFKVVVRARDDSLAYDYDSIRIRIVSNQWPLIDSMHYSPSTIYIRDTVAFRATARDPDGSIAAWKWYFGDGDSSVLASPVHVYSTAGPYNVRLRVTDNKAAFRLDTLPMIVRPNIVPTIRSFRAVPETLSVLPDTVRLTCDAIDSNGVITNYFFRFGDGRTSSGISPVIDHLYIAPDSSGRYRATVTVTDDDFGTVTDTIYILQP